MSCFLEQHQRAGHIGVDETLRAVGGEVRFVQSGCVHHRVHAGHCRTNEVSIGDRADMIGKGRWIDIQACYGTVLQAQGSRHGFAKMSCASGHEDGHDWQNQPIPDTLSALTGLHIREGSRWMSVFCNGERIPRALPDACT